MADYSESSIKVLKGLEAVRKRPGMYVGSTDLRGLHHLVWEILDNAIDEAMAGKADAIDVEIMTDGSLSVTDNGRGVPVGIHAETGISAAETAFTILHAGGKFDGGTYKTAGGLHGVGASVVNALSKWLVLTVWREGFVWSARFADGGKIVQSMTKGEPSRKTGTAVHFLPDAAIFSSVEFNLATIRERLRESSFLFKNLTITLRDRRAKTEETFKSQRGIEEFVGFLNDGKKTVCNPAYFEGEEGGIGVEVAFQYTTEPSETVIAFANSIKTNEGGTHVSGFRSALTRAINEYAREQGELKEREDNFDGEDIAEGMTAVVSVKVPERIVQFEGQTKNKLFTPEARSAVEKAVLAKLPYWLTERKKDGLAIVARVKKAREARLAAKNARDEVRKLKGVTKQRMLSGKLTPCQSRETAKNELFIVEGESAGGSAKLGRDRHHQAILPLRGKVINVEKARLIDLISNEEIATIIATIGAGVGSEFDVKSVNYGKVVIMTDADTDGAHIQVLLLTFFYRYMRPLIENGMVYVAMPPLYKLTKTSGNREVRYAWDDHELATLREEMGKTDLQRYKGLGEMNYDQLWDTTMNPASRQLVKVNLADVAMAERRIATLMGDNVEARKLWITENVNFEMAT